MGKVVKAVVGIVTTVVGFATGNPFLIALGASQTLSSIAGTPQPEEIEDPGQNLNLAVDPTAPRRIAYGKVATGGTLAYRDTVGPKNDDLWMVTCLCGHEINGITKVFVNGEEVTFSGTGATGAYAGKYSLWKQLGTDTQAANSSLVAASGPWTTAHQLKSVAYVVSKLIYDPDVWTNGLPAVVYELEGKKLYDPRKDPAQGGSGSHVLGNKATYEYSDNPILVLLDYLLGEIQNGVEVFGMQTPQARIDFTNFMAEANICDELVALKAGGNQKRYTCNGWIDTSADHETNIRRILSSCAGKLTFQGGMWRVYVGTARAATYTRTEDHFVGKVSYKPKKKYRSKMNCVRGLYTAPDQNYKNVDYPVIKVPTYITEDGGQEIWGDFNLPMTNHPAMAQRLSKIYLGEGRMARKVSVTTTPIGLKDQAMDAVYVDYPRYNLISQKMMIESWALRVGTDEQGNSGILVDETYLETDDNIYAWAAATDEQTVPLPGTVNKIDKLKLEAGDIEGLGNLATQNTVDFDDVDGVNKPANNADVTNYTDNRIANGQMQLNPDGTMAYWNGTSWVNLGAANLSGMGYTGDLDATVGDPFGASYNLLGSDAGPSHALTYNYFTLEPIANLGLAVGDIISVSALLTSTNASSLFCRTLIDFFDGTDTLISRHNGNFLSGTYTDSLSKIDNLEIPATTTKITVFTSGTNGTGTTSRRVLLNRGPVALPYVAPFEDGATVGADWDTNLANKPAAIIQTFYQSTAPVSGHSVGDFWIDSDDNKLWRYNGSSWVAVQDNGIATAINNAATAQSTADGKVVTFAQTSAPSSHSVGDLWIDTDDNNKLWRSNGSSWVAYTQDVADWTKIFGTGKPADNATVGAPTGTNVGSTAADTVEDGATRAMSAIASSGISLAANINQLEPTTGHPRRIANATSVVLGVHGQSFTFDPVRAEIPSIIVAGGGIGLPDSAGSVTAERWWRNIGIANVTTAGFDLIAQFMATTALPTTQVDTGATGNPPVIEKSIAEEAIDDVYDLQFDVLVNIASGDPEDPIMSGVTIAFDTRSTLGGAWTERAVNTYSNFSTGSTKTFSNQVKKITVDGLGTDAAWRVRVKSTEGNGGSILSFDSVTYNKAGGSTILTETATPGKGENPITIFIAGGKEETVQ